MDYYLHNYLGYTTNHFMDENAKIIQKAFKNHRSFEINRRIDVIRHSIPQLETECDNEEIDFWNEQRNIIKREIKKK